MKKFNRKGDIPVTILVLGVLAVCGLALLSFYIPVKFFSDDFSSYLKIVQDTNNYAQQISFYNSETGENPEEIIGIFQEKERNGNIEFMGKKNGDVYTIEGKYYSGTVAALGFDSGDKEVFSVTYSFNP